MDFKQAEKVGKKWGIRVLAGALALAIVGSTLYTLFTINFSYSKGERVGFVQKLSRRGWVCKTWEGDLAMVNMAGQQAQMFTFTVPKDEVAKQIESYAGHRVVLEYEEHKGIPSSCFGDTQYFIVGVKETKE